MISRWMWHSYSLEMRKLLSYRVDFWVQFAGSIFVQFGVAYFLWSAIFEVRGTEQVGGYTFPMLMLYYILAPLVERMTMGDSWTHISTEIYEGTLTRYIVYPMPVLPYKYIAHIAKTSIGLIQLVMTLGLLSLFFDRPAELQTSALSVLQGIVLIFFAGYLYFIINLAVEMIAFWADSVWSLLVMVKFTVSLLGGAMLPLTLFPEGVRKVLEILPFSYFISFPIRCFMGQVTTSEWLAGLAIITVWAIVATLAAQMIWRRGSKNYAGVGQ
ncbi:MAG TPA: ABC-2 family transporter protein [Bdellovibrionales bacterium]|nr:ABC-2 family transporter protein [Bdellovibrionales bacterium]